MKNYIDKWNKYTIGKVDWINKRAGHPCRKHFVNFVIGNSIRNILEIGIGEGVEYKQLKHLVRTYTVLDVSTTFLKNHKGNYRVNGDMVEIPFKDKSIDLSYGVSVLCHSPNVRSTIKEICRVSKQYYFTMFKWYMNDNKDLKHFFEEKKQYYTSTFNIYSIFEEFKKYSTISATIVTTETGRRIPFSDYAKLLGKEDEIRNGDYLSIIGVTK